ncbi:hypothetical protein HY992_06795 [Candidatus Micrarchaeota archaeon]|nr:hypothetical protein [Candidatus Micrarchaeota archaeon]
MNRIRIPARDFRNRIATVLDSRLNAREKARRLREFNAHFEPEPTTAKHFKDKILTAEEQVWSFIEWCRNHDIQLWREGKIDSFPDLIATPRITSVAESMYLIPEDLMTVMRGRTIWFFGVGQWGGRMILEHGRKGGIELYENRGHKAALHEFGHALDHFGIRGDYAGIGSWRHLDRERKKVFDVTVAYTKDAATPPVGHISNYSSSNPGENFAEHFAFYISAGPAFRMLAAYELQLRAMYYFFKNKLFHGREY